MEKVVHAEGAEDNAEAAEGLTTKNKLNEKPRPPRALCVLCVNPSYNPNNYSSLYCGLNINNCLNLILKIP